MLTDLTSPAGVDLVLELSRVNALLPSWTDCVLPLVLHLQGATGLAGLKLRQFLLPANRTYRVTTFTELIRQDLSPYT